MSLESRQVAAVRAADSFFVGGNWGLFVNTEDDFDSFLKIIKSDRDVKVIDVENGFITFSDTKFLYDSLCQVMQVPQEVVELHKQRVQIEGNELKKIINAIYNASSKYAKKENGVIDFNLGIYSINKGNKTFVNGVEYPSVNMTLEEVYSVLSKYLHLSDIQFYTSNGYRSIREMNRNNLSEFYKGIEIANSGSGAFVSIRLTR